MELYIMHGWNNTPNSEKLFLWKNLRTSIQDKKLGDQLSDVSRFFSGLPYGSRSIDYFTPLSWPTPWEIMFYGNFCKSTLAVMMYYTLAMVNNCNNLELHLIDDKTDEYLILVVDGTYVLNYEYNEISDYTKIKNNFALKKVYSSKDIKEIK